MSVNLQVRWAVLVVSYCSQSVHGHDSLKWTVVAVFYCSQNCVGQVTGQMGDGSYVTEVSAMLVKSQVRWAMVFLCYCGQSCVGQITSQMGDASAMLL